MKATDTVSRKKHSKYKLHLTDFPKLRNNSSMKVACQEQQQKSVGIISTEVSTWKKVSKRSLNINLVYSGTCNVLVRQITKV